MAYADHDKYAGDANLAKRQAELPDAIDRIARKVSSLEEVVGMLTARLDPVLRSQPPSPAPGGAQVAQAGPSTSYARQLWGSSDRLEQLGAMILDLQQRLEV